MVVSRITRRKLVEGAVAAGSAAILLAACAPAPSPTATPAPKPAEAPKPAAVAPTAAPPPTAAPQPTPAPKPAAPAPTAAPKPTVAPAAAKPTKPTGEIIFWSPNQAWNEFIQKEFHQVQSDIKLAGQLGEWNEPTKHLAALAAGNPPSVSATGRHLTAELAVRNALRSVDDLVKTARTFKWENIWARLQKDAITWGKKWLVPWSTDTRALYYNKEVMADSGLDPEKPPKIWKDLEEYAVKILKKDRGGRLERIGFTPTFGNPPTYLWFYSMLWCMGSDLLSDDYTKVRVLEKGPDAMAYLKKLMDSQGGYEAAAAFTKSLTLGQGLDAFSAGKVGLALHGQGAFSNYDKYAPKLQYGMIPGPVFPEYNENANYDGGGGLYFFKKGKNFDAAWEFAEFMMEPTFYLKFAGQFNLMPARSDVGAEWEKGDKRRGVFNATANTVHWIPIIVGTMEILTHMSKMFDDVMFGKEPIDKALPAFAQQVQIIVDKHSTLPAPAG
ncbi:MAG: extracellular solute-binding protein [Chloroflexi bacterium]|nr:extracellular solute-binding protein [Chloroflexota bacterium]